MARDPRSAEIIKPVLRGRDIRRYQLNWKGLWLIATFPARDLNIDDYPAVKKHLLAFGRNRLEQSGKRLPDGTRSRKKTSNDWFELQDTCAYHEDFAKEKLLWMDMSPTGRFAYSDTEEYCNNKGFIMTGGPLKYLCSILNSAPITWLMRHTARTTGVGLTQWEKFAVERLPIPKVSPDRQGPFVRLVDHILCDVDGSQSDTITLEAEIDRLVYELYELTEDEIEAITNQ